VTAKRKKRSAAPRQKTDVAHQLRVGSAHRQAATLLRDFPNVEGVGIGYPLKNGKKERRLGIIVWVSKKRDVRAAALLPREILGVRVDVQVAPKARLLAGNRSAAGSMQCRGEGRDEFGHLGMLARRPDGKPCALTTLHVLVDEAFGDSVDAGTHRGAVVEAASFGSDFERIGKLTRGAFGAHRDDALVLLDNGVSALRNLSGATTQLGDPLPLSLHDVGAEVRVHVPEDGTISGELDGFDVAHNFDIESGSQTFTGLLRFSLDASSVRSGWCGSVVYAKDTLVPLAMISFGTESAPALAWGFPIAPIWSLWGLSSI
jgi:hypothetical protein